jgi:transcriptional regulator with XRE-family HTH domain
MNSAVVTSLRATLARYLREARREAGLSQKDLAKALGISRGRVAHAEQGLWAPPEAYSSRLLEACGLPQDWPRSRESESLERPKRTLAPSPTW